MIFNHLSFAGVYYTCDDIAAGAKQTETHHPEGDREDGEDHQQEVQRDSDAAQAVGLRGRHGPQVQVP